MPYFWQPFQRSDEQTEAPSLGGEVLEETFAQAFEENPLELWSRARERQELETGVRGPRQGLRPITRINPEQAAAMVKDSGVDGLSYSTDTSREAVELDIERKKTERKRQDIFARSPGGVGLNLARFGVAVGTTLSDPISMGLNFVPVVSQARYAKWLGEASTLGRVGVRAGVGAAEGLAGAAIYEPVLYSAKQAEQADYDVGDSLLNLSLGTVLGAGMHTIGGTTADAIRRFRGLPDPYIKITPFQQAIINGGKTDAPVITKADIEAGGARLDAKLEEVAQVASAPATPIRPDVTISDAIDYGGRGVLATTESGETLAIRRGDMLQVTESKTVEGAQGKGEGTARIAELIKEAEKRELRFGSDTKVSAAAAKVYDRLERDGYTVKRNSFTRDDEGNLVSDSNLPVFEVTASPKRNAATVVRESRPEVREHALRTAVTQVTTGDDVNVSRQYGPSEQPKQDADTSIERSTEAEESINARDDTVETMEEDATIERQLTDLQAKQLGIESDALKASDDYVKKIKRWSQAAELAQVCLARGG